MDAITAGARTLAEQDEPSRKSLFDILKSWDGICDTQSDRVTAQQAALADDGLAEPSSTSGPLGSGPFGLLDNAKCHVTGSSSLKWYWYLDIESESLPPVTLPAKDPQVTGFARRLNDGSEYGSAWGEFGTLHVSSDGPDAATFGPIGPVIGYGAVDPECPDWDDNVASFGFDGTWLADDRDMDTQMECTADSAFCVNLRVDGVICVDGCGGIYEVLPDDWQQGASP